MSRVTKYTLLGGLGIALALACADPNAPGTEGTYTAQVRGGKLQSLRGTAELIQGTSGYGRPTVELLLGGEGARDRISLLIAGSNVPAPGVYPVVATSSEPLEGQWSGTYVTTGPGARGSFPTVSGSVRIIESGRGRLQGIVNIFASGPPEGSHTDLLFEISGNFDAVAARPR